jgi:glycosyltransferase involved in cell wall biosynthesis
MNNSIFIYTNGICCLPVVSKEYNKNKIVFIGNMRTLQNQDAVQYFVKDIFPPIKKKINGAVFHIVGADPPNYIKNLADGENIVVSGFVDIIEDEIKDAAVAVAPVRIAAGIQNKVLIAMACNVPVVLTSIISSGIPELESGNNCIIVDNKREFSDAVLLLMNNSDLRDTIAKNGYELMKNSYSWNMKLKGYENLFDKIDVQL